MNAMNDAKQQGFTLVEVLVGMVIGLIATIVITQTFSAFEGSKRTTTGVSEAQTNGSIGLYLIQRELEFAGYGIPVVSGTLPDVAANKRPYNTNYANYEGKTQAEIEAIQEAMIDAYNTQIDAEKDAITQGENFSAMRCNDTQPALEVDHDDDSATPAQTISVVNLLTPVAITDGATSDSVNIRYFDSARGGLPTKIKAAPVADAGEFTVGVENNLGCRAGDIVLVIKDANLNGGDASCLASQIPPQNKSDTAKVNQINTFLNDNSDKVRVLGSLQHPDPAKAAENATTNNRLACLGRLHNITFDVNNNELRKNNQAVLGEIVSLQAQYGVSAVGNSEVVPNQDYTNANGGWTDATGAWAAPSVTNRNRIKAVRLAVIARNNLLEKVAVSQTCDGTASGLANVCVWGENIDLNTSLGADWNRYRYRVYELVVPLKNILAGSPQLY